MTWGKHCVIQSDGNLVNCETLCFVHSQRKGILNWKVAAAVLDPMNREDGSCGGNFDNLEAIRWWECNYRSTNVIDFGDNSTCAVANLLTYQGVIQKHDPGTDHHIYHQWEVGLPLEDILQGQLIDVPWPV